jgi:hypothetical protein
MTILILSEYETYKLPLPEVSSPVLLRRKGLVDKFTKRQLNKPYLYNLLSALSSLISARNQEKEKGRSFLRN